MKFLASFVAGVALTILGSSAVYSRDLDRTDGDRALILNAARQGQPVKFVVLDLFKDGDAAYLCALKVEDGQVEGTSDGDSPAAAVQPDLYRWGFKKQAGGWKAIELPSGPTATATPTVADCDAMDGIKINSRSDIARAESEMAQQLKKIAADTEHARQDRETSLAKNHDNVIPRVLDVIQRHKLTSLRAECLDLLVDDKDQSIYTIDVHENHSKPGCDGDPSTWPRLFSFEVDRKTGAMKTDALDPADGDMQPIK
jgi:hypothetical protein